VDGGERGGVGWGVEGAAFKGAMVYGNNILVK